MTVVRIQSKTIRIPDNLLEELESGLGKAASRYGFPDSIVTVEIIWHQGLDKYTTSVEVPGMYNKDVELNSLEDADVTNSLVRAMPIHVVEIPEGSCKAVGAIDTRGTIHWRPL